MKGSWDPGTAGAGESGTVTLADALLGGGRR